MGVFPQKNGLNLVGNIEILEYNMVQILFFLKPIDKFTQTFPELLLYIHNKRFIITISGGGYPFKNFQACLKLNFTWDKACNRFICVGVWVCSVETKAAF